MCDYSLMHAKSRPAVVGERLVTTAFENTVTRGMCPAAGEELDVAVCVRPGTELGFSAPIEYANTSYIEPSDGWKVSAHSTAIFRQINIDQPMAHHDALELPDGHMVMVTFLRPGQDATVLQLPAEPRNAAEVLEQTRLETVG